MIKDSLYAKYIEEREGAKIIENDYGYLTYKLRSPECFLANIFVLPEYREEGIGGVLLSALEKEAKINACHVITANIDLKSKLATGTLIAAVKAGFQVISANNDILLIAKEIKGETHG